MLEVIILGAVAIGFVVFMYLVVTALKAKR